MPLVGITSGYCFAGNAALLGCCDVIIATEGSNIGMGGPAMIEGGGLGVYDPKAIGPTDVQNANGVIDVLVADEAEAVRVGQAISRVLPRPVRRVGVRGSARAAAVDPGEPRARVRRAHGDRRAVRHRLGARAPPRLRAGHDHRAGAASRGGRSGSSRTIRCTSAARSTAPAADKAARFLQLCDAFDVPVLFLCDTPGFMVGPRIGGDRGRAPRVADVRDRRQPHGSVRDDHPAQGLRPRRAGDGRRLLQGAAVLHRVADRRVRRDGPRGRGAARPAARARCDRRSGGAGAGLPVDGRAHVPARQGHQRRESLRDRRRDRPGGVAALDHDDAGRRRPPPARGAGRSARTSTLGR